MISKKFDKYIKNKQKIKYKKLETNILKYFKYYFKNARNYSKVTKKNYLSNNQMSFLASKKN